MSTVTLELSELTMNRAKQDAVAQNITVEKLLADSLEPKAPHKKNGWATLGLFADDPDIIDDAVDLIYSERVRPNSDRLIQHG